jgi:hypothetical protein
VAYPVIMSCAPTPVLGGLVQAQPLHRAGLQELASHIIDAVFVRIDVDKLAVRHTSCGPDAILLSSFFVLLGGESAAIAELGLVLWYSEYTMI